MKREIQQLILETFHDGCITGLDNLNKNIILRISIPYLAQMVSPKHEFFYLELVNCEKLSFFEFYLEKEITDLKEISEEYPEILECQIEDDLLLVYCTMGKLTIKAEDINIYDHDKEILVKEFLFMLAKDYWKNPER